MMRWLERVIAELTTLLNTKTTAAKPDSAQKAISALTIGAGKLLTTTGGSKP